MLNGMMAATFEDVGESDEIAVNVRMRICQRIADAGLSREMDDTLRSNVLEQFSRALPIRQIKLPEMESWPIQKLRQPILLQRWIVVVVQVVHAEDFVPFFQKPPGYVEADEASRTCY